ncbi:MAG: fumarate hydratase C-terminal domain-containing protein [Fidelibacterota bacterium]|nr:MAG: fumarate hydratase C-terminal domain-containing protein [Candidatus Neomarinimicrobiota bacterium]
MNNLEDLKLREVRLRAPLTEDDIRSLEIGDVVFLDGVLFTGREGLYSQLFDLNLQPPVDIRSLSNVTFHCSPAVNELRPGEYHIPAVSATASFRFDKYIPLLFERYDVRVIIGKGGMQKEIYQSTFRKYGAVYLTTVGYGLGALYGRGIRSVKDVHWKEELGLAQAMWVLEVENLGPFLVECNAQGRSLFEMANAEINQRFEKLYAGLPQPKLKRLGEVTSPTCEVL